MTKIAETLRANATARLKWLADRGWTPQLLQLAAGDGTNPEAFVQETESAVFMVDRLAAELGVADPSSLLAADFDPTRDPEPGTIADERLGRWFVALGPNQRQKAIAMFEAAGRPLPTAASALLRNEREKAEREALDAQVEAELRREEAETLEARRAAIRDRLARDRT